MNEASADFWMNTINAGAYTGLNDLNLGKYFFSLFIIVLIMLVLAWLAHKAGWLKSAATKPIEQEQDQVVFYAQFTQDQTLLIVEQEGSIHCYIQKNNQTILATPLPGLVNKSMLATSTGQRKSSPSKLSFQEVWKNVIGRHKGKRS